VTISARGLSFDAVLGVYTGVVIGALTEVASNDDEVPFSSGPSRVTFVAVAGRDYQIAVDGYDADEFGAVLLTVDWNPPGSAPRIMTTSPLPDGREGMRYDVRLQATGGGAPYSWTVALGTLPEGLSLDASSGMVGGIPSTAGPFSFRARVTGVNGLSDERDFDLMIEPSVLAPPNDDFVHAIELTGSFATGSNAHATKEPGEPNHAARPGGRSIWWRWRAPTSGHAVVSTAGSGFDTLLGVYTGSSVSALVEVGGNDDVSFTATTSQVRFNGQRRLCQRLSADGRIRVRQRPECRSDAGTGRTGTLWSLGGTFGVVDLSRARRRRGPDFDARERVRHGAGGLHGRVGRWAYRGSKQR
jgi:hypothetical protein